MVRGSNQYAGFIMGGIIMYTGIHSLIKKKFGTWQSIGLMLIGLIFIAANFYFVITYKN